MLGRDDEKALGVLDEDACVCVEGLWWFRVQGYVRGLRLGLGSPERMGEMRP